MSSHSASEDLLLARRVLDGSLEAWHELVERYTGLINYTIGRVLRDPDEVATVYVAVLEGLHAGRLAQYKGEARLATWIVVVARSAALDRLRHLRGRPRPPAQVRTGEGLEPELYRLHFEQGLSLEAIRHRLRQAGHSIEALESTLASIRGQLSPAKRRRLDWARQAREVAAESGRLLEYFELERHESEQRMAAMSPEAILIEKEARETLRRVLAAVSALAPEDRELLALRFGEGCSAREISERLGLDGPRRAFTRIDTALRRVRKAMAAAR